MITTNSRYPQDVYSENFSGSLTLSDGSVYEVNDDNIVSNSVVLTEACCNGAFGFGAMITSKLDAALFISTLNPFLLDDAKITLDRMYYDSDGVLIQKIPLGTFYVDDSSVKRTSAKISFTGYDVSRKFDVKVPSQAATEIGLRNAYGFVKYACDKLGIPLITTKEYAINNIPNCGALSSKHRWKHSEVENITYRQMICAALQLMGAFGRIDRTTGGFEIKQFDMSQTVYTINESNAIKRNTSDLATQITGVRGDSFLQGEEGYVYDLTGNLIIMSFGSGEQTLVEGRTLYELSKSSNVVGLSIYTADITWFGDLSIEPGDCILYSQNGIYGDDRKIIVMETVWKPYRSCTIRSFGTDSSSGYLAASSSQSGNITPVGSNGDISYVAQELLGGLRLSHMSKSMYDALSNKSPTTIYVVNDNEAVRLYLGSKEISGQNQADGNVPALASVSASGLMGTVGKATKIEEV